MHIKGNMLRCGDNCYDLRNILGVQLLHENHPDNYHGWRLYLISITGHMVPLGPFVEMTMRQKLIGNNFVKTDEYKKLEADLRAPMLEALELISLAIDTKQVHFSCKFGSDE